MSTSKRGPGQRAGLDRDRVLVEARALLDEVGLGGLTMRSLAARLDVAPNTLYSHIRDKGEMVDLLLDEVLADVPVPTPERLRRDPVDALRRMMTASYDALLQHPGLVPHYLTRQGARGPFARRLGEAMMDALGHIGLTGPSAQKAMRVLIVNTIGFAAFSTEGGPDAGPWPTRQVRAGHSQALDWLLAGITGETG